MAANPVSVSEGIELKDRFEQDGVCFTPPVIEPELLDRVIEHMDQVIAGKYETGEDPLSRTWNPGDDPTRLVKIDQPHWCDRTIREVISHPAIGQLAAAITGAKWVQAWAVQLLFKPPSGSDLGNVGWHQDEEYWKYWEPESEVFTAWLAISDVTADSGPVRFVRGSHLWGNLGAANFFDSHMEDQRHSIPKPEGAEWDELYGVLPPGAMSFHHRRTLHGSGPNLSAGPRRGFAVHLRTERSRPLEGSDVPYITGLADYEHNPVLFSSEVLDAGS